MGASAARVSSSLLLALSTLACNDAAEAKSRFSPLLQQQFLPSPHCPSIPRPSVGLPALHSPTIQGLLVVDLLRRTTFAVLHHPVLPEPPRFSTRVMFGCWAGVIPLPGWSIHCGSNKDGGNIRSEIMFWKLVKARSKVTILTVWLRDQLRYGTSLQPRPHLCETFLREAIA